MSKSCFTLTALALAMALAGPSFAQMPPPPQGPPPPRPPVIIVTPPGPSTKVGMLTCNMSPGVGFIVGGRQSLACRFAPSSPSYAPKSYLGEITTIGLDIGVTSGGLMAWAVFMPTQGPQYGSLAGEYVGASGEVELRSRRRWQRLGRRLEPLGDAAAVLGRGHDRRQSCGRRLRDGAAGSALKAVFSWGAPSMRLGPSAWSGPSWLPGWRG